jgi:hypothetical protein
VRLCVVPNDLYQVGQTYDELTALTCSDAEVTGGTLALTQVWDAALAGTYDLLALDPETGRILAVDNDGPAAGLTVAALLTGSGRLVAVACLLLLVGRMARRDRLRRQAR